MEQLAEMLMKQERHSETARNTAVARAAHLLMDDEPAILNDTLAAGLTGLAGSDGVLQAVEAIVAEVAPAVGEAWARALYDAYRSLVVIRSRYAEDMLAQAVARGVRQYVILGAGLDSFALRQPAWARELRIFEVDHPATQAWKRQRLQGMGQAEPGNLRWVAVDFERASLSSRLAANGFDARRPAFFSWLGVTQYLSQDAILSTLGTVSRGPAGTEVVLEYFPRPDSMDAETRLLFDVIAATAARRGEPVVSTFDPGHLAHRVAALGFKRVSDFGPQQAHAAYLRGRNDRLRCLDVQRLLRARAG